MQIAIGTSRRDRKWTNTELSWQEFLKRVKCTKRTSETVEEYKNLPKPNRDDIKDVGGFVAGKLKEGKRKNGYVEYRSMLTLDMDYATPDIWDQITLFYDFTCCIYSTHKHTSEYPRLRLIIPLLRNVTAEEYTAISRMVASDIGIELFDDTTYEPVRLMYWPSTPQDGLYVFESQQGNLLNPDDILARYIDWRDSSQWPISSRQHRVEKQQISKQADPLEKEGIIGAFCRAYSVQDAIEAFIPEVYKPSLIDGRYDFVPADSTAGVVVYDDKWLYSHHATDPVSNKLCNSFDLVRLHLFGHLDERSDQTKSPTELESFKAMQELCTIDDKVKFQVVTERMAQVNHEFSVIDVNWKEQLSIKKNGQITEDLQNLVLILRHDEQLKSIAYNQHKDSIDVKATLPWKQIKGGWTDSDMSALKVYLDQVYGIWSPTKVKEALVAVAAERAFHPVKDYLDQLPKWDGVERLNNLLIDYLGADDTAYSRAVIRKTLVAAVARIYNPGTKFDTVLILNGPQGVGKSTFFARLAHKWFSDSLTLTDMRDKAAAEKLQGYWLLELGELAGIKKTDVETVKSFVSRTDDKYRASYGVNVESHPRQCVIVGTTNSENGFLRDITGNRRFWPVRVNHNSPKKAWQLSDVEQIWAEALSAYRSGEELFLKGEEAQLALSQQADAMETDDREGLVREYLDKLLPTTWSTMDLYERRNFLTGGGFSSHLHGTEKRQLVCSMEIWCECFGKDASNLKKGDSFEINAILSRIEEWQPFSGTKTGITRFPIYNKQRAFMRTRENQTSK